MRVGQSQICRARGPASTSLHSASHLGGDGRPGLLDVQLRRALALAVDVPGRDGVETFVFIGHMGDNEGVTATFLQDPDVLAINQRLVWGDRQ